MSHSRSHSRNPSREPSPRPSLNTRVSRFSEQYGYDVPLGNSSTLFVHPDSNDAPHLDKEALLMPATRPALAHATSGDSDSERLLTQARQHANAEAGAYLHSRQQAALRKAPPPQLSKNRRFYVTRLVLRFISAIISVIIIAVLVDSIRSYKKTKDHMQTYQNGSGRFRVWPENLKLWPTLFLLGVAVVACVLSTILCIASLNQRVRRMTKTGNISTVIISFICLALWFAVTAYYASWDTKDTNWDLLSWSCKHSDKKYNYTNIDFGETCTEMRFALWAAVALSVLEFANVMLFVIWLFREKRRRKYSRV